MAPLPAHVEQVAADLHADADNADETARQRESWAASCERQATAYREEAAYLHAYAQQKRRLAEAAG